MSTAKSIPGITLGPDFDRERAEPVQVERINKETKLGRAAEVNDPVIAAAIDAVSEMAGSSGRQMDISFEPKSRMIVVTFTAPNGEQVVRQLPPEEAIRMAQNQKDQRSTFLETVA